MNFIFLIVKVTLGISELTTPELIQYARNVVNSMTANPNFLTPQPKLIDVTAQIDALEQAYLAALDGGKSKKQAMYAARAALMILLNELAGYVQSECDNDAEAVATAGMSVRKENAPVGLVNTPENMRAKTGVTDGSIDFKWKSVKGSTGYIFEYTDDPIGATPWIKVEGLTKASITVTGLESGKKYWGRAKAICTAGMTNFSDPAIARAM